MRQFEAFWRLKEERMKILPPTSRYIDDGEDVHLWYMYIAMKVGGL